jgi:membrane protease YdiL (CAAX protease family)
MFSKSFKKVARWYASFSQNLWVPAVLLIAIAAVMITLVVAPVTGIVVDAVVLALLMALGLWHAPSRKLAISVGIIPTALLVNAGLPATNPFMESVIFYNTLLFLTLVYRFIFTLEHSLTATKLTLRGYAFSLPLMIVLGQVVGLIGYGLLRHDYPFQASPLQSVAATAVLFAIIEEMLFRGLIQQTAAKLVHPAIAAMLSAGLFALIFINHTTILTPIFALIAGAVLATVYYKKQNVILTTVLNISLKLTYIGLLATFVLR